MLSAKKLILIADDDADDQELLAEAFARQDGDVSVHCVSAAGEFFDFLHHTDTLPALIVLDYNIPGRSGLQILEGIRSLPHLASVPVVVWSTSSLPLNKELSLMKGARQYFIKPAHHRQVLEMAAQMLGYCRESVTC